MRMRVSPVNPAFRSQAAILTDADECKTSETGIFLGFHKFTPLFEVKVRRPFVAGISVLLILWLRRSGAHCPLNQRLKVEV